VNLYSELDSTDGKNDRNNLLNIPKSSWTLERSYNLPKFYNHLIPHTLNGLRDKYQWKINLQDLKVDELNFILLKNCIAIL
jgi:hypothetical protein